MSFVRHGGLSAMCLPTDAHLMVGVCRFPVVIASQTHSPFDFWTAWPDFSE
jgi:hypothetical protein